MNEQPYAAIKERYHFAEWRNRNTLSENLFLWQFFFNGDEFPSWRPHLMRSLETPTARPMATNISRFSEDYGGAPRVIQSVWQPAGGQRGVTLSVDGYECPSRAAAHEVLIRILSEFQSPLVDIQRELTIGDVTFAHPGNRILLFARANDVFVVRSLGQTAINVTELARQFDNDLIDKPSAPTSAMQPAIRRFEMMQEELQIDSRTQVVVEASHPRNAPLMYKFFSAGGEMLASGGELLYEPHESGDQTLEVYAIAPERAAVQQMVRFKVR